MDKQDFFKKRITELSDLAYTRGIVTFSDFLTLEQISLLSAMTRSLAGVTVRLHGGYEEAERKVAAFIPHDPGYAWSYPISCIKVSVPAHSRKLPNHRDYLGAALSLGIDRAVLGDILVKDDSAFLFCLEHMSDFLQNELIQIASVPVRTELYTEEIQDLHPNMRAIEGSVASPRLDSLIALAFGASRSRMLPLISGRKVFADGKCIENAGYHVPEGTQISVRGYGKFLYAEALHQTKKGRLIVRLLKYV